MIDDLKPYLNNELTPEKEEVITKNLIQLKFDEEKKAAWKRKLESEYKLPSKSKIGNKNQRFLLILLAIVVSIIAVLVSVKWPSFNSSSPEHVQFAQNIIRDLEPIQDPSIIRKDLTAVDEQRASAMILFSAKEFESAKKIYEAMDSSKQLNSFDKYYFGMCYLKSSNYDLAVMHFNQSLKSAGPREEINWALVLAYASQNNKQKAIQLINQIIKNDDYGAAQANVLLEVIRKDSIE